MSKFTQFIKDEFTLDEEINGKEIKREKTPAENLQRLFETEKQLKEGVYKREETIWQKPPLKRFFKKQKTERLFFNKRKPFFNKVMYFDHWPEAQKGDPQVHYITQAIAVIIGIILNTIIILGIFGVF